MTRSRPNIIITGTPGVGKTSLSELLAESTGLRHLSVNAVVKERGCHEGWDERLQSWVVDEDKLLDALEAEVLAGGNVIDYHACDLFPESWIDLVVVLRADTATLYDRLMARGYGEEKVGENMDAEIMQVVLEEAREGFDEGMVVELWSCGMEDLEGNCERVEEWVGAWMRERERERGEEGRDGEGQG